MINDSKRKCLSSDSISEIIPSPSADPSTCSSSGSSQWAKYFNKTTITLQPGSPCNDFKGYCDVFMKCRLVDADGPLARLKKAIFNAELYENIAEWIVVSVPVEPAFSVSTVSVVLLSLCLINVEIWSLTSRLIGGQCCWWALLSLC